MNLLEITTGFTILLLTVRFNVLLFLNFSNKVRGILEIKYSEAQIRVHIILGYIIHTGKACFKLLDAGE